LKQGNKNGRGFGNAFWTRFEKDLSPDPHLTDVEFIEFAADVVDAVEAVRLRNHVARCSQCAGELGSLREIGEVWNDSAAYLEARISRPKTLVNDAKKESWWEHALAWTSLAPLGRGLAAMAAADDTAFVDFAVEDEKDTVDGLTGVIQRRGDEYYVRVSATAEVQDRYLGRMVDIAAVDSTTNQLSFQRKINLGQFVLIGTKLDIGSFKLSARLLP